jgi:hypothetical protein
MGPMSAHPIDIRLSALEASVEHLNGAYEQIDRRLGDLRSDMNAGFARVDQRFEAQDRKIDGNLQTIIGWMLGQTAVILAAVASVAFALRH